MLVDLIKIACWKNNTNMHVITLWNRLWKCKYIHTCTVQTRGNLSFVILCAKNWWGLQDTYINTRKLLSRCHWTIVWDRQADYGTRLQSFALFGEYTTEILYLAGSYPAKHRFLTSDLNIGRRKSKEIVASLVTHAVVHGRSSFNDGGPNTAAGTRIAPNTDTPLFPGVSSLPQCHPKLQLPVLTRS